jgi:hypothetical protein
MMKLLNKVTFQDVVNSKSDTVYYSTKTKWWTDDPADLQTTKPLPAAARPAGAPEDYGSGLPCDRFGCVLFQIEKEKWVANPDKIAAHYGSLDVLMAMHHKNFQPEDGDPLFKFTLVETFVEAVEKQRHGS